jgi:hypothetical protein
MRRALCVLAVSVTLMGTAQTAHAEDGHSGAAQAATDIEVSSAMAAAVNGDNSSLERLLASPKAPAMRSTILEWVRANPEQPELTLLGLAAGGPTNALGWAVLGAAASWNVLDLWQNCKRR